MPIPAQQEMGPRSGSTHGQWAPAPNRRSGENPTIAPTGGHDTPSPQEIARFGERLAEMERIINIARRQSAGAQPPLPASNLPIPMHNVTAPASMGMAPTAAHSQGGNSVYPPPIPHHNSGAPMQSYGPPPPGPGTNIPPRQFHAPMPLIPPPPPYMDDIFRDFSLCSPQEFFVHETRLYQRINFQAKIRLGYGKAISVLQRELDNSQEYERITRPYQIDQPDNLPSLSPLIPNSEARLFADTVRALVDIIGLQRSCHLLENAKVEEIPGIRYEIQRVTIPSRVSPIPLEAESVPIPPSMMPEIGPFARPRSDSVASATSSAPTMYSWGPAPMTMSPPPLPSNSPIAGDDLPSEDMIAPPQIPTPIVPQRGILRRSSSGSSYHGKRVTIQMDQDGPCASHYGTSSPIFESVMSPVAMSPIKMEDVPIQLGTDFQHRTRQSPISEFKSINPEDVLQQMAAAQM